MAPDNFARVTLFDFAKMEGRALVNRARSISHEGDKLLHGEQGFLTTIVGVLEVMSEPSENCYDFPPPGHFHIERGH